MMSQCIAAVCALGIVIIGVLLITQVITIQQALSAMGRALVLLVGSLFALCIVRSLLLTVIVSWLRSLKALVGWLAIIAVAIILIALVFEIIRKRFKNGGGQSHWGGEP